MAQTSIQWTDHSINPLRASTFVDNAGEINNGHYCVRISDGCKNCYSSRLQSRFGLYEFVAKNRRKVHLWLDESKLLEVRRRKKPTKYFWCDMTDMFLDDYPDEWIDKCFATMALTPWHTHQVLTKRAERMRDYLCNRETWMRQLTCSGLIPESEMGVPYLSLPLLNVQLGVSVENQPTAEERIRWLLKTPATVRFVSYEPALSAVDFRALNEMDWQIDALTGDRLFPNNVRRACYPRLDQIIVGGESGPRARPFDIQWVHNTIRQCRDAGVACFVKQLGSNPVDSSRMSFDHDKLPLKFKDRKGGSIGEWPTELRVREFPEAGKEQ